MKKLTLFDLHKKPEIIYVLERLAETEIDLLEEADEYNRCHFSYGGYSRQ